MAADSEQSTFERTRSDSAVVYAAAIFGVVAGVSIAGISALRSDWGILGVLLGGACAILALLLGLARMAGAEWGRLYVLIVAGGAIGLVLSEVGMLLADLVPQPKRLPSMPSIETMMSQELTAGRDAAYPVRPNNFYAPSRKHGTGSRLIVDGQEVLPFGGLSNRREIFCYHELAKMVAYRTDRYGFRNADALWDARPVQVLAIGDSLVRGLCVHDGDTFVDAIRKELPGTLNLGVNGVGPLAQLAILREYGPVLRPKVVVFSLEALSDLVADLYTEKRNGILASYLDPKFSQDLVLKASRIDAALFDLVEEMARNSRENQSGPAFGNPLRFVKFQERLRGYRDRHLGRDIDLYERILVAAKTEAKSWGGKVYVLHFPIRGHLELDSTTAAALERADVAAISTSKEAAARGINLLPLLGSTGDHYTTEGYAFVGQIVIDRLRRDIPDLFGAP